MPFCTGHKIWQMLRNESDEPKKGQSQILEIPQICKFVFSGFCTALTLTQETHIGKDRKGSSGETPRNKCRTIFAAVLLSIYLANSLTSFHPL